MESRHQTLLIAALGLGVVALAGLIIGQLSWPVGGLLLALAIGAAWWLRRRAAPGAGEAAGPVVQSGLRIAEKPLRSGKARLPHGLRVTISTEVAVSLGLRVVCDTVIQEVEALVQMGRGTAARQGIPQFVRESRQAWLFVVRNSPGQRELFLRVDLFAAQPILLERVEQIRPGGAVVLPEWKELDQSPSTEAEAPAGETAP